MSKREWIEENYEEDSELLFADGFDEAIIGVTSHWAPVSGGGCTQSHAVAYDYEKCIQILMEEGIEDYSEAVEFFEFNTIGAYVGEHTPVFVRVAEEE